MSNGYIEASHFGIIANRIANRITTSSLGLADIETILSDIKAEAVAVTNTDLIGVARDVARVEYEHAGFRIGRMRKIEAIKTIRTRAGVGLKEGKQAYEQAVPVAVREHAEDVLKELDAVNSQVSYGDKAFIDATEHAGVLSNMWAAANDPGHSPF